MEKDAFDRSEVHQMVMKAENDIRKIILRLQEDADTVVRDIEVDARNHKDPAVYIHILPVYDHG